MRKIAFLHPDLGLGGAERLVVDAALSLQKHAYDVTFYTSHHSREHCFPETKDGTLKVKVSGDFLPISLWKKFFIIFAILRNFFAVSYLIFDHFRFGYDVIFIDQLSVWIPLVKIFTSAKVIFYCHHPDKLLTTRGTLLKTIYRLPVDFLEEVTTYCADCVLVNSHFTLSVVNRSFRFFAMDPIVLYPAVSIDRFMQIHTRNGKSSSKRDEICFVSINRFERKKNIELAVKAFAYMIERASLGPVRLIVSGGYDPRVSENVEYYSELCGLCEETGLTFTEYPDFSGQVVFLRSFTEEQRVGLMWMSRCVLYTPSGEHFGIVPIEAMAAGVPVLAVNDGGPLETVQDNTTGWLRAPDARVWGETMCEIAQLPKNELSDMRQRCKEHVVAEFSLDSFGKRLNALINETRVNRVLSRVFVFGAVSVLVAIVGGSFLGTDRV